MRQKAFNQSAGTLLGLAALLHLLRVVMGWDLVVEGFLIPVWVSILVVLIAGFLSYTAFKVSK